MKRGAQKGGDFPWALNVTILRWLCQGIEQALVEATTYKKDPSCSSAVSGREDSSGKLLYVCTCNFVFEIRKVFRISLETSTAAEEDRSNRGSPNPGAEAAALVNGAFTPDERKYKYSSNSLVQMSSLLNLVRDLTRQARACHSPGDNNAFLRQDRAHFRARFWPNLVTSS
ncbi:TCP family transcription factor [Striga asiatica]|uniref:TCP family transcription factor n=1 Tax=Striga asiatica TaxID=4170 RepID=A0A5A7Q1N5_STRAF|nr:TCP family transcription factor [Striga asiatica]